MIRRLLFAGLLLCVAGCHFDGSSSLDEYVEESGDPVFPPDEPEPDTGEPPSVPFAPLLVSAEFTEDGYKLFGSYQDLEFVDDEVEHIRASLDYSDSELEIEQRWELGLVPAGEFELTFVARGISLISPETFTLSYRLNDDGDWNVLSEFTTGDVLVTHLNDLSLVSPALLEIRAKMDDVSVGSSYGGISTGGGGYDSHSLTVDQLVLTEQAGSSLGN